MFDAEAPAVVTERVPRTEAGQSAVEVSSSDPDVDVAVLQQQKEQPTRCEWQAVGAYEDRAVKLIADRCLAGSSHTLSAALELEESPCGATQEW